MTVKPFVSAKHWEDWQGYNGDYCAKRGIVPGSDCPMHAAVYVAMANGGQVDSSIASRIGYWWLGKWFWDCLEREVIKLRTLQEYHAANKAAAENGLSKARK